MESDNNINFDENIVPDRLQNWPDCITLKDCKEQMEQNQVIVIEQTRSLFCKSIMNAVNNSVPIVALDFPKNLLNNNKILIIKELIDRFGAISVDGESDNYTLCEAKCVNDMDDIPPNPTKIYLEFLKEN